MRIHERSRISIPTLLDVEGSVRRAVFDSDPAWFVFAVVRNPFSRLVSVFENKVRLGEPRYRHLEAKYGDIERFGSLREAFAAYVAEVVCNPGAVERDAHLKPQTKLIMPRLVPYTRILRLENLQAGLSDFRTHLAKNGQTANLGLAVHNQSFSHEWRSYFDAETAQRVAAVYSSDFKSFDYDPEDWRYVNATRIEPSAHTLREELWRREVIARNAMIDELYERLSVARPFEKPRR